MRVLCTLKQKHVVMNLAKTVLLMSMKRRKIMAGHTPWREIKRKRDDRHKEIARQVVECWLEDCVDETLGPIPSLSTVETKILLHHIEIGIMRGEEDVQAQRNIRWVWDTDYGKWIARPQREVTK
ncbi:hypothetical protein LCGC14_0208350 [marine sediment metagenome]|uniref:Uncharacterized protein n=1 Tax=marine sediment metagenome TaxID=412755 RepID=A0A0F9UL26_9ZZZZ